MHIKHMPIFNCTVKDFRQKFCFIARCNKIVPAFNETSLTFELHFLYCLCLSVLLIASS